MDSYIINIDSTNIEPNLIIPPVEVVKNVEKKSINNLIEHTSLNLNNEELKATQETGETDENSMPIRPIIQPQPPPPPQAPPPYYYSSNPPSGGYLSRKPFFSGFSSRNREPVYQDDSETEWDDREERWKDQNVRRRFIVRVLAITLMGLGITTIITCIMLMSLPFLRFLYSHPIYWILNGTAILFLIISMGISCYCIQITLRGPYAILHYFVWVYILTVIVLFAVSISPLENVIIALACTVSMVGIALIIVRFVKFDFTKYAWIIVILLIGALVASIIVSILSIWLKVGAAKAILSFIIALILFCVFIIDLQMVMGGRRKELETDMYWFGALSLYIDIVMIFLYLLQGLNQVNQNN